MAALAEMLSMLDNDTNTPQPDRKRYSLGVVPVHCLKAMMKAGVPNRRMTRYATAGLEPYVR